jgi:inosine/xanthosine triphosphate pyrophosphatase family protein
MEVNPKFFLKVTLFFAAIAIIGGYSYYKSKNLLAGPIVEIKTPSSGTVLEESLISIEGVARNITHISLNDRPITIDDTGYFSEKLILFPGYNVTKVSVRDRFGKERSEILELVYREPEIRRAAIEFLNENLEEETPSI